MLSDFWIFPVYIFSIICILFVNSFAIREGSTKVKLFRNFKERKSFKPEFGAEGMYVRIHSKLLACGQHYLYKHSLMQLFLYL